MRITHIVWTVGTDRWVLKIALGVSMPFGSIAKTNPANLHESVDFFSLGHGAIKGLKQYQPARRTGPGDGIQYVECCSDFVCPANCDEYDSRLHVFSLLKSTRVLPLVWNTPQKCNLILLRQ